MCSSDLPAADKIILVTLQVQPPSPLSASPTSLSITCVRGSGIAGHADVAITSTAANAPFFSVDTSTLPIWLTVDVNSALTPKSVRFLSTQVCDSMTPGAYTTTARFKVTGYGDLRVTVSLLVTNKASKLSVAETTTRNLSWTIGTAIPTATVTAVSSDTPIPFTVTTAGALQPSVPASQTSGLAYSFGTPLNVSFGTTPFSSAQAGQVLSGTVTLSYGTPSTSLVVTFNITVQSEIGRAHV